MKLTVLLIVFSFSSSWANDKDQGFFKNFIPEGGQSSTWRSPCTQSRVNTMTLNRDKTFELEVKIYPTEDCNKEDEYSLLQRNGRYTYKTEGEIISYDGVYLGQRGYDLYLLFAASSSSHDPNVYFENIKFKHDDYYHGQIVMHANLRDNTEIKFNLIEKSEQNSSVLNVANCNSLNDLSQAQFEQIQSLKKILTPDQDTVTPASLSE